jgi:hypothetical protein
MTTENPNHTVISGVSRVVDHSKTKPPVRQPTQRRVLSNNGNRGCAKCRQNRVR